MGSLLVLMNDLVLLATAERIVTKMSLPERLIHSYDSRLINASGTKLFFLGRTNQNKEAMAVAGVAVDPCPHVLVRVCSLHVRLKHKLRRGV